MVTLADIRAAEGRIAGHIIRTPVVFSPTLSAMTGAQVWFKLEALQKAGSFKVRGASNKILAAGDAIKGMGVVAASAGNHAQGVVVAAHAAGVPAVIVMPEWAAISKQEATRGYGAQVILHGRTLEESIDRAESLAAEGRLFIHPFDDGEVIAGQGTIGLEILADLPETDLIVVPVGGGGLIAGIATAAKALRPEVSVVGVQAAACPSAEESLRQGRPAPVRAGRTIADGIRVAETGDLTFSAIRDIVDTIVVVTEEEIADAMLLLLERKHIVAEGAGAAPLAALMNGSIEITPGSTIVLVISGGNVDSAMLFRIVRQSMARQGRILRFSVLLDDQPGTLARLLSVIAEKRGNILHIHHTLGESSVPVQMARVHLELETRGRDHGEAIKKAVAGAGYEMRMG
ncbi:MAG: threonine ammonia-lyase [Methanomicrobiales archaeon HGW-Methanomicrobiales-3]|jgi:threonine dehydratase|nr:MAG: threonine ammonia-lyase [Methanomicrobiales archaeon HGW-Methanomicrobiales-3]